MVSPLTILSMTGCNGRHACTQIANGTNRKDISFISRAVATSFMFYLMPGRDYVDIAWRGTG